MRGFNAAQGRTRQIYEFVGDHRLDFVCLQETIKNEFSLLELRKLVGGFNVVWHYIPAIGHSGGILVGARVDTFEVKHTDQGQYFCSMTLVQKTTGHSWELICVYGPACHSGSADFIFELSEKV